MIIQPAPPLDNLGPAARGTGHRWPGRRGAALAAAFCLALSACAHGGRGPAPLMVEEGTASWYGDDFHGRPTSTGARYSMYALTAASKTIPLGSRARVTRLDNGRSVEVEVNDRGPFVGDRILDLSYGAAIKLDMLDVGLAPVRIEVLSLPPGTAPVASPRWPPAGAGPAAVPSTPAPAVPAVPAAPSALSASGPARLSLGSFALERTARWLERQVAPRFPGVAIEPVTLEGVAAWRVVVPTAGPEEAERVGRELAEMGLRARPVEVP